MYISADRNDVKTKITMVVTKGTKCVIIVIISVDQRAVMRLSIEIFQQRVPKLNKNNFSTV